MATRIVLLVIGYWLLALAPASAQVTSDVKDIQVAKQKLQIGTDAAKYLSSILHVITGAATHNQSPTAKAVYDFVTGFDYLSTVQVTARLSGNGTVGHELDIAQNGATTGQVLRWSGSAWVPNGLNLYHIVTNSQTVTAVNNEVWINTISADITLNLPTCNSANNGVKILFGKVGTDSHGVTLEPAGSEEFIDGETAKTLYSRGTGLSCTCRYSGGVGKWLYINM